MPGPTNALSNEMPSRFGMSVCAPSIFSRKVSIDSFAAFKSTVGVAKLPEATMRGLGGKAPRIDFSWSVFMTRIIYFLIRDFEGTSAHKIAAASMNSWVTALAVALNNPTAPRIMATVARVMPTPAA